MAKKQSSEKTTEEALKPQSETLEGKIYQIVFEKINSTGIGSISLDLTEDITKEVLKLIKEK